MRALPGQKSHCAFASTGRILIFIACAASCAVVAQVPGSSEGSQLTQTRLKSAGWWPTKGDPSRDEYVGPAQCVKCHASQAADIQSTAMARAATPAADAESLQQGALAFQIGPYNYRIKPSAGKNVLTIGKAGSSVSANLLWAFGVGRIGQTYIYEKDNRYYESHLTFYTAFQALDITPGHPRTVPPSLEEGGGRRMSIEETRRCFGCHTTASSTKNRFDPQTMFLGVTCEACHGPGAEHVAAAKSGMDDQLVVGSIENPARLTPAESVDFCGACHRTLQDVIADGPKRIGTLNVRFSPYRLENSRCWKKADARITCVACHDPHQPLNLDPASYDSRCLQCHLAAGTKRTDDHQGTACPVGVKLCVTCHMPKFRNPALHTSFTDHWIRIAPPGAPLPD
jgi:cytochrome c554/c'-like protein